MTNVAAPDEATNIPIACRPQALTKAERERSRVLREEIAKATKKTTETKGGYTFELPADGDAFKKAAEWITMERRCCPFLTFDLHWAPGDDRAAVLSVTGPEGTKAFLAAEMPELPHE